MKKQPILLTMYITWAIAPFFLKNNGSLVCFVSTWKRSSLRWDCAIPLAHSSRLSQFHAPCLEALFKRALEGRHRYVYGWLLGTGDLGGNLILIPWFFSEPKAILPEDPCSSELCSESEKSMIDPKELNL